MYCPLDSIKVCDIYNKNNGSSKGSQCLKCSHGKGVIHTLNKIKKCTKSKFGLGRKVQCSDTKALLPSDSSSMPSSENRVPQNVQNKDPENYKTTLVLHLRDKKGMSRQQSFKSENIEKLIDLESNNRHLVADSYPSVEVGDRVVFVTETGQPEEGVIRWLDNSVEDRIAGVEFKNAVGTSNGTRNKVQYFQCERNHGEFIPLSCLVKADDYYLKSKENLKRRAKIFKEKQNSFEVSHNGTSRPYLNNKRSELDIKIIPSEPFYNDPDVELITSHNDDLRWKVTPPDKNKEVNMCRSEYVFSEADVSNRHFPNICDDKTKQCKGVSGDEHSESPASYSRNKPLSQINNFSDGVTVNKFSSSLDKYVKTKGCDTKIRHSHSQDSHIHNGLDCDLHDIWPSFPAPKSSKDSDVKANLNSGFKSKLQKQSNSFDLLTVTSPLECVDTFVPPSPSAISNGEDTCYEFSGSPDLEVVCDFTVGSVVEVPFRKEPHYGVIRWIGVLRNDPKGRKVAGIEMEQESDGLTDGTFNGFRYFHCQPRKAFFVTLNKCRKDGRFQDVHQETNDAKNKSFGQLECPVIPGAVAPITRKEDFDALCGKNKGIQGHHNSCYLDATLFSMFVFTSVFDSLLFRPPNENDIDDYEKVQKVLREDIVNPLRKNLYVRADKVMKLRTLLENLSSVTGLTSEEKDPEEFLTSLVAQILRAEPFLKLSSGQEAYHYQLFVEKDEHIQFPTVQRLFEQSFLASDIKLKEVPSCLIIQMPRFGKSFKMYPRIFPSQILDVTDVIEDSPRQCTVCGKLAEFECKECFSHSDEGLEGIAYCRTCLETVHNHQRRSSHAWRKLTVPTEFSILQDHCPIPRLFMELFAVVCIETSHYVAFVKCGTGNDAPWCFFDSMADRKGEQNGYNIPEVVACPNLPYWLSEEGYLVLQETKDDRQLPEHAKRLICDAYMCMYQSSDVMMYR